jgi:predicted DNA-binding WGR domain protein
MTLKDSNCTVAGDVLKPYSCTLNQTDITANSNKFYIIQVINSKPKYYVYIRYGRIGEVGKSSTTEYSSEYSAIGFFKKQFKLKTGNDFDTDSSKFIKKAGKYFVAELEEATKDSASESESEEESEESVEDLDDEMDDKLKYFIDLISNKKMLADTLIKLNIDQAKMPLGKISKKQIESAKELLQELKSKLSKKISEDELNEISSEYYTLVPYSCGRRKPPLIDSVDEVDKYLDLLTELENVRITYTIISKKTANVNINRLTNIYNQLNAIIEPLSEKKKVYSALLTYVKNTHCATHYCNLEVLNIYTVKKDTDKLYDEYTKNIGNKTLLFHGSPIVNWCSIIKNGLLLDPSKLGVRITGKMFGYGIYWANTITKSFNYCGAHDTNNIAVLAIGEVALGETYQLMNSDWSLTQQSLDKVKKNSTHGIGQWSPESVECINGINIPNGKLVDKQHRGALMYDEFIIYNSLQYKIKYLIVVKNNYGKK